MIDVDVLTEVYSILKQYIPSKDRQEAADNLMSSMVDVLNDQELKDLGAVDAALTRALKEYVSSDDEYDDHCDDE